MTELIESRYLWSTDRGIRHPIDRQFGKFKFQELNFICDDLNNCDVLSQHSSVVPVVSHKPQDPYLFGLRAVVGGRRRDGQPNGPRERIGVQLPTNVLPFDKLKRWWRSWYGVKVPAVVQIDTATIIEELDLESNDSLVQFNDGTQPLPQGRRERYGFISELVSTCKCELPGIGIHTQANRLVAQEWLYKNMKLKGMRPLHIKKMLPIAVELVFVLNSDEIFARQMTQTHAFINRLEEGNSTYYSRDTPWLLNWLGTRRSGPNQPNGC